MTEECGRTVNHRPCRGGSMSPSWIIGESWSQCTSTHDLPSPSSHITLMNGVRHRPGHYSSDSPRRGRSPRRRGPQRDATTLVRQAAQRSSKRHLRGSCSPSRPSLHHAIREVTEQAPRPPSASLLGLWSDPPAAARAPGQPLSMNRHIRSAFRGAIATLLRPEPRFTVFPRVPGHLDS